MATATGAVDERRRQEVAIVRLVDGIGRDFGRTGGSDDRLILTFVTGGGKDQRHAGQLAEAIACSDGFDAMGCEIGMVVGLRIGRIGDDPRVGIAQQPDLGIGLVAIAENGHGLAADAEECWKCRQKVAGHAAFPI